MADEESIRETSLHILRAVLPVYLANLLLHGRIDRGRLDDWEYLNEVIHANFDVLEKSGIVHIIHEQFIATAAEAIAANRPFVAVVLIATAVEQALNQCYRDALTTHLSNDDITEMLRSASLADKTGWLLDLVFRNRLPEELAATIKTIAELRNQIVHYKAKPTRDLDDESTGSYYTIEQQLQRLDLADLLRLPEQIIAALEQLAGEMSPDQQLAKDLAERWLMGPTAAAGIVQGELVL